MEDSIKDAYHNAQEYAELHGDLCDSMMEYPDECNCDEMKQVYQIVKYAVEIENNRWVELAQAHRVHCSPEGKKDITKMQGKKNRL